MNKDTKTNEYLDKLKDIKLSETARARIEGNLIQYAKFHSVVDGVRVTEEGRSIEQVHTSTSLFRLFKQPKSMTAAILAIALMIGGGTSYAAEGSVPGDALYMVKTDVNENIKSAFAFSNDSEAKLQARLAAERLEEAEELAARGKLTADASADINTRLKAHYEEAQRRSDSSEAEGDYESSATVRAALEGTLRTYVDVLTDLNARVSGNNSIDLINGIRTYADGAATAQATATTKVSVDMKSQVEATINRSDKILADVEAKLARAESKTTTEAHTRAKTKFAEAVSAQAEAKASLSAESYQDAYDSVQKSIRIANEVSAMIDSMLRLDVDVKVDADSIIDGLLNVHTDVDSQKNTTTTEAETASSSDTDETEVDTASSSETNTKGTVDVEIDEITDKILDTEVINLDTQIDTSLRSGLSL